MQNQVDTVENALHFLVRDIKDVTNKPHLRPMLERALKELDFEEASIIAAVNELIPERTLQ